jgi:hypothetical protein
MLAVWKPEDAGTAISRIFVVARDCVVCRT